MTFCLIFLHFITHFKNFLCYANLYTSGIVAGLTGVNLPDIEKEFGFSSKKSAVILLANDIGGILMLPFVSFYGTHAKKPKWIGIGAIITGKKQLHFQIINTHCFRNIYLYQHQNLRS